MTLAVEGIDDGIKRGLAKKDPDEYTHNLPPNLLNPLNINPLRATLDRRYR